MTHLLEGSHPLPPFIHQLLGCSLGEGMALPLQPCLPAALLPLGLLVQGVCKAIYVVLCCFEDVVPPGCLGIHQLL